MTETARPSDELIARMVAFVRKQAKFGSRANPEGQRYLQAHNFNDALAIVAELPKPTDPDLIEARELAVERYGASFDVIREYREGRYDSNPEIVNLLAGIKRGREMMEMKR